MQEGVVVWFRPEMGTGVVKLRAGRQYRFSDLDGLDLVTALQVVQVTVVEGQPAKVTLHPLPNNEQRFDEPPPPPKKKRPAPKRKTTAKKTTAKKTTAKKTKKSGVATKLKPKADGTLPVGLPVLHPQHGQGFIVVSSAKAARVRFMPHEEERSVRVEDLQVLDKV